MSSTIEAEASVMTTINNSGTMAAKDFTGMISSGSETVGAEYLARYDPGNEYTGLSVPASPPWPPRRVPQAIGSDHAVSQS
jgi:hypothetical protein